MTADGPEFLETSAPLGMGLIATGVSTLLTHALFEIFTGWLPAVVIGGMWFVLGALLLFPDVRLYQFEQSPLEQLLLSSDQ